MSANLIEPFGQLFHTEFRFSCLLFGVHGSLFKVQGYSAFMVCIRVQDSGFWVHGLWFRIQGSGFMVYGSGFRVLGKWFRVQDSGFCVHGLWFRIQGSGYMV